MLKEDYNYLSWKKDLRTWCNSTNDRDNFALLQCCICPIQVLVDELAAPRYRGFIIGTLFTSSSLGIMAISSLGALVDWRTASALAALPSVISAISLYFVHDSPTWFVRRNRMKEAERTLLWLWGPGNEEQVSVSGNSDGVIVTSNSH
jgi:hypothetical protein